MTRKKLMLVCLGLTVGGFALRYSASNTFLFMLGNALEGYSMIALVSLIVTGLITTRK